MVGVGEGTTIGGLAYGGESPEGMKLAVDTYFALQLLGADPTRVPALMARIDSVIKDNRFARSAVETALLDAHGKRTGLPVSELLGGRRRARLPVGWTLASGDTARDIDEAEQMLDQRRHNVFKLKIGARPLDEDIAHVAAIKRALGDRGAVRVDVNMAWSELQAARGMAALADAGCELVEQPVATAAAADVFAVKIEQSGGLYAAQRAAGMPDELIDALIDHGASGLTIINNNAGNGDTGLAALIANRRV